MRTALVLAVAIGTFWWTRLASGDRIELGSADVLGYFYPTYETTAAWLREGRLPLWNPYQLCGMPWLATWQGGFFYPPHALYLLLPTHVALASLAVAHLVGLGLATAALARRAGVGAAGAVLAAFLAVGRGDIPWLVASPNFLEVVAWLPIGCLGVLDLVDGRLRRGIAVTALAVACALLAGYPQVAVYEVYAWAALLAVALLARPGRALVPAGVGLGAAVLLGALLAAAQLLPAAELAAAGARPTRPLTVAEMYPMGGAYFDLWRFLKNALAGTQTSFSVTGAVLVVGALLAGPLGWWALGFGALALLFALGPVTPLFAAALHLPALAWFRIPTRIMPIVDFCVAVAAGAGLHALTAQGRSRWVRALPVVVGVALAVVAWRGDQQVAFGFALASVAVWTAVLLVTRMRPLVAPLVLAAAALEVFVAPPRGLLLPYRAADAARFDAARASYEALAPLLDRDRFWLMMPGIRLPEHVRKQASRFQVRSTEDYEPQMSKRQAQYIAFLMRGPAGLAEGETVEVPFWPKGDIAIEGPAFAARRRLLDLAAVRYLVAHPYLMLDPHMRGIVARAGFGGSRQVGPLLAFANAHALPRAFVTYRTLPAPPAEALLPALAEEGFDPLRASYVEGAPALTPDPAAPERGAPAPIVRDDATTVEVDASLAAPGLVVLADTFYPGWHATVDGTSAPIVATNHLFRGVPAPAGRHRVRFEYRPWRVPAGIGASLVALLVVALLLRPAGLRGTGRHR